MNIYYHTDKEFKNIRMNLKDYLKEFCSQLNKQRNIKLDSSMVIRLWSLPNTLNCVDIKRLLWKIDYSTTIDKNELAEFTLPKVVTDQLLEIYNVLFKIIEGYKTRSSIADVNKELLKLNENNNTNNLNN